MFLKHSTKHQPPIIPHLWYDGIVCLGAKLLEYLRAKRRRI